MGRFNKDGSRRCRHCNKVMPKEHFIEKINKLGKSYSICSIFESKKQPKKKHCGTCYAYFTMEHFMEYKRETDDKIMLICKKTFEKNGNKLYGFMPIHDNFKKGKPRKKHLEYELYSTEYERSAYLSREYGITLGDYNKMFESQQGCCAICSKHQTEFKRTLVVDHNHETGKIRALLCHWCNSGIGMLKDSKDILQKAVNYLNKYD